MNALQSAASQPMDSAPVSPIEAVVDGLRKNQYRTSDLLGLLEQRLAVVLKPASPVSNGGPKAVQSGMSPLHAELLDAEERAALLNDRLQEAIDRLVVG